MGSMGGEGMIIQEARHSTQEATKLHIILDQCGIVQADPVSTCLEQHTTGQTCFSRRAWADLHEPKEHQCQERRYLMS